ncbi:MAG TPA: right-handed parallel beta-helix repeat-containing protein [Candidatus Binatia bacterium]
MGFWGWRTLLVCAVAALLAAPASAAAKECGNGVACACGDAVRGVAVLDADLVDCAAGLRVKNRAVLDCAGHAIVGRGDGDGIVVDEAQGAVVRGCTVSGFRTGIRLRGGSLNRIEHNDVVDNARYGIELAVATKSNMLIGNVVVGSGDEGIHIGTAADDNVLVGNEIADSGKENLYLLDARGNFVLVNRLRGAGSAAMYVKHSKDNLFFGNEVEDRPIQLRGESERNVFEGNLVRGAGYLFQAYEDAERGWKGPRENQVRRGAVREVKTCFRFEGAAHNTVTGVIVNGCSPVSAQKKSGGIAATGNVVDVVRE